MKGRIVLSRRGENIYYRKDKRWEGRYRKGKTLDGKIKYGSVYGKTYNEVRKKLYPLKLKYQDLQEKNGEMTVALDEWCGIWLKQVQPTVEKSTFSSYTYKIEKYVLPYLPSCFIGELTKEDIQQLVYCWQRHPLAPSSIRVLMQVLKSCLNQALEDGLLRKNPCQGVKLPKKEKRKQAALSLKQQRKLESAALTYPNEKGIPIAFALHTGLRIGEVSALKWENIDFDNGVIHVTHTVQRVPLFNSYKKTELIRTSTKTQSSKRVIPMSTKVRNWLWKLKKKQKSSFVFSDNEKPNEPRLITYHLHQLCKKGQVVPIHFHQLRHTFATRCVEAKADISSISSLLGHSSTQMTLDVYAHSLLTPKVKTIQLMEHAVS